MVYFVSTPIGNLQDITFRAIDTLNNVDVIACEDTRHSLKLLNHYNIKKPLISNHKFNEISCAQKIVALCLEGKSVAVISDAGTPAISDPGNTLIQALWSSNIKYTVIPGANAVLPALMLSGFDSQQFVFIGFLQGKNTKVEKMLAKYKNIDASLIFYSAPQDINKDVQTLFKAFGERKAALVKEITKIYESCVLFNLSQGAPEGQKLGEYVIVVEGAKDTSEVELTEREHIQYYIQKGFDKNTALKMAAKDRGVSKSDLYKFSIDL